MQMNKYLLIPAFLICSFFMAQAQYEVGVVAGASLYEGDLSKTPFNIEETQPGGMIFGTYDVSPRFDVKASFMFGKISGDDANKETSANRNLRFKSNVKEFALSGTFDILDEDFNRVVPYVQAGVAFFHHNPYVDDGDNKIELQPLGTEGQGIEGYADKYSLTGFALPLGFGVKYGLNEKINIIFDAAARFTNTNYLDDVGSEYYAKPSELLAGNGDLAYKYAYRAGELSGGRPYTDLEDDAVRNTVVRSFSDYNDKYYLIGFGATYNFGSKGSEIEKNRKGVPYNY